MHQRNREFGSLLRLCRHRRHGLSVVFRLADREDRPVLVNRPEARNRCWQLVGRNDIDDTGHGASLGRIDGDDACSGRVEGDKLDMKHARKRDIGKKLLVSAYAFASAETPHIGADPGFDVLSVAPGRVVRLMLTIFRCAAGRVFRAAILAVSTGLRRGADGRDNPIVPAAAAKVA